VRFFARFYHALVVCLVLVSGILLISCSDSEHNPHIFKKSNATPPLHFAVASDLHIYSKSLGISGLEFNADLHNDRTLVEESGSILDSLSQMLVNSSHKPEFLLISGDLTRNGAKESHLRVTQSLAKLEQSGIEVFVVPGNHDILNPDATGYTEQRRILVESVSAEEFALLYFNHGYSEAFARDRHSLSYIVEPMPGYWLFAIDSCRYYENGDYSVVGGRIKRETLAWVKEYLELARLQNKQIIAMMHHPLIEHAVGQGQYLADFVLENREEAGNELASAGLRCIFTGHQHAQKTTQKIFSAGVTLVDIQTGALTAWPNPYRIVTVDPDTGKFSVQTRYIDKLINAHQPGMLSFTDYSRMFSDITIETAIRSMTTNYLKMEPQLVEEHLPLLADAVKAFFCGDHHIDASMFATIFNLSNSDNPAEASLGDLFFSLSYELPPADNNFDLILHLAPTETDISADLHD
jgi:3',5'-cyclic AMP phosphodiesterase CpdA